MTSATTTVASTLSHRIPGLVLTEREFDVPLDHGDPGGERLTVFAREVADPAAPPDLPYLLYLQGGPGQESPRPTAAPLSPGWLGRALREYRVLLLDQRGTGRSTPVGALPGTPAEQAADLTHFRADAIVRDAEAIRAALGVERWSLLGQSFGGFCAFTYLSLAPEALSEVFVTGGVPPVGHGPDPNYRATYATLRERNARYHRRYPGDRDRLARLLDLLDEGRVTLPDGTALSARRFRQLGHLLGMSDGAERLHHLLERDPSSPAFAHDVAAALPFSGRNPLYVVLHEACCADGQATRWSAQRVMPDDFASDRTLLTGEHVAPWLLEEDAGLAPLREAGELLAAHEWPRLYDPARLAACDVPAAAAVYADDAYVDRALSEEAARGVPSLRVWLTNEYEHNALRVDGARVLDRLIAMARGEV